MWNKVELKSKRGLFLMNNGLYVHPNDGIEVKDKIIGYCLDDHRIMSINSNKIPIPWSLRYGRIPGLTDYEYEDGSIEPYNDLDGRYNTNCIIEFCKENNINLQNDYPAIYYCKSFSPGFKDGEWYLPSIGEMKLFYDRRNEFRKSCKLIGLETNMSQDNSGACYFKSSTEHSVICTWNLLFNCFSPSRYGFKDCRCYVVPFLNLNPLKP